MTRRLSSYKEKAIEKALIETTTPLAQIACELNICLASVVKVKKYLGPLPRDKDNNLTLPF